MSGQLGSLTLEVAANVARFQSDMGRMARIAENNASQMQRAFDVVGTSLKALGAGFAIGLTIDKVKGNIESVVKSAAGLQQMAERTGATVEGLSGLASAAKLSGTDTDALAGGLQKLSKAMVDAQGGGKLTTAAFGAIGMSVKDLKGQTPDQTFYDIAMRLVQYADGAEKTALAQALLGKSGANLLPVMNDLAAVGSLQVKTTEQQAQMADQYEKTLVRLNAVQNQIYKRIAFEMLPVMNAFADTMLDTAKQGNALGNTVNDLAADGSLRTWAEDAATAMAAVVDTFATAVKMGTTLGSVFGAIGSQAKVMSASARIGWLPAALGGASEEEMQQAIDGREKALEKMHKQLADLETYDTRRFADALDKRLAAQRRVDIHGGGPGGSGPGGSRPRLPYSPSGEGATKDGQSFIKQLQRQVEEQTHGRFEMMRLHAEQKGVSETAEEYIAKLEQIEIRTKELASFSERWTAAEEDRAKLGQFQSNGMGIVISLREQASLLGLNATQQRRVTELRQLDAIAIKAVGDATDDTLPNVLKQWNRMRDDLVQSLDETEAAEKRLSASFKYGANKAFDDYLKNARDNSKFAENLVVGGLQRMEDALINFAKTGKLSFSDLFSFMAEEYLRQQIRMSIADFATGGKGAGGASILASAVSFFKGVGSFANGTPYVPYDNYPAMLHEGERVLTKAEAQGGGWSGGASIDASINGLSVGAGVSLPQVQSMISRALGVQREQIMRTLRHQGAAA